MRSEFFNTREVLEAILVSIDEGIHVMDKEGITIFYNKVAATHDGMRIEEVLGKPLLSAFPSLTHRSSTLLTVIETEKPIYDKRQSYLNVHGKVIETINTTLPLQVDEKLIGAIEIAKDYSRLKMLSDRLLELENTATKVNSNKNGTSGAHYIFSDILTKNEPFLQLIHLGKKAANSTSSVFVFGESGVGKELFVQSIHNASDRSGAPFIAQNCAALPESLLEGLLFGTAKGSFTGAVDRAGLFELAHGGTLFLDELQSMPIQLQSKLLRVLEDGLIRRIGGSKSIQVDVRIMAAMNISPNQALKENLLRADLFYRLNVLSYELPPLRKRPEDIKLLTNHFIDLFNRQLGRRFTGYEKEVMETFSSYHWPGNVRELKHTIEYMMNISETMMLKKVDLPAFLRAGGKKYSDSVLSLRAALKETEQQLIQHALAKTDGNVMQAAKILEVPRQTLQYKIQKLRN